MPTRPSKRPRDVNELAAKIVRLTTGQEREPEDTRNPHALAMSKLGASKGGKARKAALSKKERVEIAKKAAKARWATKPQ